MLTKEKHMYLDTMITDTAMRATWRSIKLAGDAPLHAYSDAIDLDALVQGSSKVVLTFFVRRCFKKEQQGFLHIYRLSHMITRYVNISNKIRLEMSYLSV